MFEEITSIYSDIEKADPDSAQMIERCARDIKKYTLACIVFFSFFMVLYTISVIDYFTHLK